MKNYTWQIILAALLFAFLGCKEGDPTALKQAVKAADLDIASITLEPADGVITTGYEYQYTAIGHRTNGSTLDITSDVVWSTSNTAIATVNTSGKVKTEADGSVSVNATLASLSGSTTLTASSEALLSIAIYADTATPNDLSVSACRDLQLKAIGTYADGVRDIIPITGFVDWTVANGSGTFPQRGLLRTGSDGTIGVQATLGVSSPVTDVTAIADLDMISVTPLSKTIGIGEKLTYLATGKYIDGSTADISENVTWSSTITEVANFNDTDSNSKITAVNQGTTTVTAACGSVVSANASLTVSNEVLDYLRFEVGTDNQVLTLNTFVGQVTDVTLRAYFTNGSDRDVTNDAQWSLLENSPTDVILVNNTTDKGRIEALAVGQANVSVVYQQREKVLPVTVTQ